MATLIGDLYQVKFFAKLSPQLGINIRHFLITGQVAPLQEQEWADALSSSFAPVYKAILSSSATYYGLSTQKLTGGAFVPQATSGVSRGAGTIASDALPAQVAGVLTLKDGSAGRSGRGRMYLPFAGEGSSDLAAGFPAPNAGYLASMTTLGNAIILRNVPSLVVPANIVNIRGEIFHRVTGTSTQILTLVAQARWATQKRRGAYGRPNADPF